VQPSRKTSTAVWASCWRSWMPWASRRTPSSSTCPTTAARIAAHSMAARAMCGRAASACRLIIRGPGIAPNSWCHQRVVGYDFFPTFCRWAGVKAPLPKQLEGGDITHLLSGSSDPVKRPREPLVFHFPHYQGDSPHSAILSGHMKLLHFYETGENQALRPQGRHRRDQEPRRSQARTRLKHSPNSSRTT
jgi:arylsulfatase A-like enzyme